jgi:arylsulfatase A-like enzyme
VYGVTLEALTPDMERRGRAFGARRLAPLLLIGLGAVVFGWMEYGAVVQPWLTLGALVAVWTGAAWAFAQIGAARFADPELRLRPVGLVVLALWFGVAGGIGEAIAAFVETVILGAPTPLSMVDPYAFHRIPVPDIAFGFGLGVLYAVAGALWRGALPWLFAFACYSSATLACVAVAWRFPPRLHALAGLVLALGLGLQIARWIAAQPRGFRRLVRATLPWPLAALAVAWLWMEGSARASGPRHAPSPSAEAPPNVLLVVLDTVRADAWHCYGYPRATTPNLDRFAARGVRFERAFTTSPWTLPSHATMFTGRYPRELFPEGSTPIDGSVEMLREPPVLAEVFDDAGYATAGFVANVGYCSYVHGLHRGFLHYEDYDRSVGMLLMSSALGKTVLTVRALLTGEPPPSGRKTAADINAAFLRWLDGGPRAPFFAFLNYFDAHSPYAPPDPDANRFRGAAPPATEIDFYRQYAPAEVQAMRDTYDDCVWYLDGQLGRLFAELERRGILDDTIVVVTSDHGEHFGEHGIMYHGNSLYPALLHVPLIVSYPRAVPAAVEVERTVSLRDLAASLLDLAGVAPVLPGTSLRRFWEAGDDAGLGDPQHSRAEILVGRTIPAWLPRVWPVAKGAMQAVTRGGLHYIVNGDGREELYDLDAGTRDEHDLSGDPAWTPQLEELRRARAAWK